jgi:hypothetical protein
VGFEDHVNAFPQRRTMVRGEGTPVARGVTPDEAFDFVLDPAQYVKADTK